MIDAYQLLGPHLCLKAHLCICLYSEIFISFLDSRSNGVTAIIVSYNLPNIIQAGIPCTVYERDGLSTPRRRDWNMGLHWAWPSFQSLVPEAIFNRIQTAQVDPSMPVKSIERLPLLNGATGELLTAIPVDRFYRLRRSKIRTLLMEGLDVQMGKELLGIVYSSDGRIVTASFEDGTSATGCL